MALPSPQTGFAIKGVPLVLIEDYTKETLIARIEMAESAVLTVNFPTNPIYGGNGLYPHDYIDGDRTGTLSISTTRYQYGIDEAATGATVTTSKSSVVMPVIGERAAVPGKTAYTVELKNKTTAIADSVKVYYADAGTLLTLETTTPAAGKYTYAAGVLTFAAADAGKALLIDYNYTAATADLVEVLTNGIPAVVKVTLCNDFQDQNGTKVREGIFVHKCRASGTLEHAEKRGTSGTPSLNFDLMDPGRTDYQLYSKGYVEIS